MSTRKPTVITWSATTCRPSAPAWSNASTGGDWLPAASAWFANEAEGDLHLVSSVADIVDKGGVVGVSDDWDDDSRTGLPDIGADEFDGNNTSGARISLPDAGETALRVFPNPFSTSVEIGLRLKNDDCRLKSNCRSIRVYID